MVKIFPYLAGETLDSHKAFLKQLLKGRIKSVDSYREGAVVIVFCPIVSRFETDITTALSNASDQGYKGVILVAMHHTFNETHQIPNHGGFQHRDVRLLVDCLFYDKEGLLDCPQNKKAVKEVLKELKISQGGRSPMSCFQQSGKKKKKGREMKDRESTM